MSTETQRAGFVKALTALFKDSLDWGRSYGTHLSLSPITVADVSEHYAGKAADIMCAELAVLKAENEALRKDAERLRWIAAYCRSTPEHWGGRWSIVIEGPAPKTQDSEDDFYDAIDAAMQTKEAS